MNLKQVLNRPNALNRWFLASSCAVTLGFVPLSTILASSIADPSITIMFDSDKEQAVKTRQAMLERVSQEPIIVSGTHIEFPGIGEVKKKADGQYEWIVAP